MKLTIIDFWDVWYNDTDGYWVNDQAIRTFDLPGKLDQSEKGILKALKKVGYLGKRVRRNMLGWDWEEDGVILYDKKGNGGNWIPLCKVCLDEERE